MSFRQRLAEWYLRTRGHPTADEAVIQRRYFGRQYPSPAPITGGIRALCAVREDRAHGHPVYTCTPREAETTWHIVYTHGGAFVNALQKAHWDIVEALVRATGATVTVPLYPLAPEHTHEETFHLLEQLYRDLLRHIGPERIILAGDSAGGNLALAQALLFRENGLPLPGHLLLFSPWLDLTLSDPGAKALESRDVVLRVDALRQQGRWWAGTTDPRSPRLSPIFGDLRGLPPMQLYQGTHDVLLPDARTLRDRVLAAGGSIQYHETPGGFHGFMGATFTPEARQVFRRIADTLGLGPGG